MAERIIIFKQGSTELVLPVTPESYQVEKGVRVDTINMHQVGEVNLFGYGTLAVIRLECMFPANSYAFAMDDDPDYYVETLGRWTKQRKLIRFIVGDAGINVPVKIENFSYGERDGSNDVYASLVLREYRELSAVKLADTPKENKERPKEEAPPTKADVHYVKYGDTLSALCHKYYGNGTQPVWERVAAYNGFPNPHLIAIGTPIYFPHPLP